MYKSSYILYKWTGNISLGYVLATDMTYEKNEFACVCYCWNIGGVESVLRISFFVQSVVNFQKLLELIN